MPTSDGGIIYNDPNLNINWGRYDLSNVIVSDKDRALPKFVEIEKELNF
jgi:dTDP-4-dehydrorhamnose 3,5-epimerase